MLARFLLIERQRADIPTLRARWNLMALFYLISNNVDKFLELMSVKSGLFKEL